MTASTTTSKGAGPDRDARRVLIVAPSRSYRLGEFLAAVDRLGCEAIVASDVASAIPGAAFQVSFGDPESAAAQLAAQVGRLDGVIGTDGGAVAVAAAVARRLGRPANPATAVSAAGDKYRQRLAAAGAGVPQPEFQLVTNRGIEDWSRFPAVVKPVDRSASQGVLGADTPTELSEAIERVRGIVGAEAPVLVERFVVGVEVAVEGLLRGGQLQVLAVFDKPDTPVGPTYPETLLVSPARLSAETNDRVVGVAEQAVQAVGLVDGPVHVECKVDGADVWFLELAARTIGGLCGRALEHGGIGLEELVIRHAVGLPLPRRITRQATGMLMLPVLRAGRLEEVRGVEEARAVDGVTDVVISVGPGERVVPLPEGDRYMGFVFARADTADEVEAALRRAWAALEIRITASSQGSRVGRRPGGRSRR